MRQRKIFSASDRRSLLFEIILILLLALILSLSFNALSPSGIRILPRKQDSQEKTAANAVNRQVCLLRDRGTGYRG